jgi:excisionase family DNA binding protein
MAQLALSVREAAELLGVSKDTIYDQVKAQAIPYRKLGGRVVIPRAALEKWLADTPWRSDGQGV